MASLLINLIMLHLFLVTLGEFKPLLMITTFFATLLPTNHNVVKATESQSKVQMFISWVKFLLLMIGHHLFVHI